MSDSYEIIDDGPCIRIVSPDSTISTIVGRPVGYHIDDAVIGAIRQQARDLDQLRADLAAAVAERDEADHFARHLVREPENIKARAALFAQAQEIQRLRGQKIVAEVARDGAFDENERLRARLAAIESKSATMTVGAKWPKGL